MEINGASYVLGAALFGASTPAAKLLLRDLSPLMLSALLYLGAATALSAYRFLAASGSREAGITRQDIGPLVGIIFFGGILGPVLMLMGLRRLSALTGSLLLNLEAPFTAIIAVGLMREHLGLREVLASAMIMTGGLLLSFQPGYLGASWMGASDIAAACLSWGIDNNLTQRLSLRDPVTIAQIKAVAAGLGVLIIALSRGAEVAGVLTVACAAAVGAICYGVSLVLDVKALRALGAARESAYFATAPFAGALLSIGIFWEVPSLSEIAGASLMAIGVVTLLRAKHSHLHFHDAISHEHLHFRDEHHQHSHEGRPIAEPHSHVHQHPSMTHEHPHVSDLHHRHSHP